MKLVAKMALPSDNWKSLGLNALLVGIAGGLTYMTQHVSGKDLGEYTPIIMGLMTLALKYVNKVIKNDVNVNNVIPTPIPNPTPNPFPNPQPRPVNPSDGGVDFPLN